MSDWREGYRKALMEFICKNGAPMDQNNTYYGWVGSWESIQHTRKCGVTPLPARGPFPQIDIEEKTISMFVGTFDSDREKTLLTTTVSCNCGKYKRIPWAYEGSMTSVMLGILSDKEN